MKMKSMKTLLTVALVATMVVGSAFSVCAKTDSGDGGAGETISAVEAEVREATVVPGEVAVFGGKVFNNTIQNILLSKQAQGAAVTVPLDTVKAALGLKLGQNPKMLIYDLDTKKSGAAMTSINAAIEALQGTFVTAFDIDLSAVENNKKVVLSDGSVAMAMGLPKGVDTTKTYVMVCVQAGGVTTVLEDKDTNPATITFDVQAGLGAYALVAK